MVILQKITPVKNNLKNSIQHNKRKGGRGFGRKPITAKDQTPDLAPLDLSPTQGSLIKTLLPNPSPKNPTPTPPTSPSYPIKTPLNHLVNPLQRKIPLQRLFWVLSPFLPQLQTE
jgi:hypothetical protein